MTLKTSGIADEQA